MEAALERDELEPGGGDRRGGVVACAAAVERARPEERVQGALEQPQRQVARAHLLQTRSPLAGLSTRRTSASVAAGSETVQSRPIETTASRLPSYAGSASAVPSTTSIATALARARSTATARAVGSASSATSCVTFVG
jgi:hypothetical protein